MLWFRIKSTNLGAALLFPAVMLKNKSLVIREVKEETGLVIKHPKLCGIKWWEVKRNKRYVVLLFKTDEYSGTLKSSGEGKVFWTKLETLKTMKLAESFDKMLDVFCDDSIQEHIQLKDNDKWIDILK